MFRPLFATFVVALLPSLSAAALQARDGDEQYRYLAGLVDKGLHDLAIDEARAFLRAHPRHEKSNLARYRLAGSLWELERRDEAAREYEALARVEDFEYRAESLFRSGEAARARGDVPRARAAFEGVLAGAQAYLIAPAHLALAEIAFQARALEEAEDHYRALCERDASSPEAAHARVGLVWCAFERGDARETAARARKSLAEEADPAQRDELRLLLGEALLSSDARAARAAFEELETAEQAEAGLRGRAFALSALGDHSGAARAFEALVAETPEGRYAAEATLQAGVEFVRAGDAAAALPHLSRAAEGGDPESLYWLAQAQKRAGQPDQALRALQRALAAKPPPELAARLHALRGDCLTEAGKTAEARAAYEASGSAEALEAGAVAALNAGDGRSAARLAAQALAAAPDGSRAGELRVLIAEGLFAAGDHAAAEAAFEEARAKADAAAEARLDLRLAWCRYLAGDLAAARERFAAVASRHAKAPEAEEALALELEIAERQGDAEAARRLARRSLERHPQGRFAARALLSEARGATGAEALRLLGAWLTRFPADPERARVLLELAERESEAGAHADAARHYSEVEALAPGSPEAGRALYGRAWSAWEQRDLAACRARLAELAQGPTVEDTLRASALELAVWVELESKDFAAAAAAWRALRGSHVADARRLESARAILAALRAEQRFEEARALLDECAQALPRELAGELYLEGAHLALDQGDPARAGAALERARRAGADAARLAEASYHVGEGLLAAGDSTRALALLTEAAGAAGPRSADALHRLGLVHLGAGRLDEAAAALERELTLLGQGPRAAEARFLLGECAFRAGDFEGAARRCLELSAASAGELRAKVLFRAGLALGRLERWSECASTLGELARGFPEFPNLAEGELWRGRALAAQGDGRAARAALERTLALDQGELAARARLGLGGLLEDEGRLDEALSEYLKVALLYAHEPSVAEALLAAGRVLEAQGSLAQARARYEELVADHPESSFAAAARERLRVLARRSTPRQERD